MYKIHINKLKEPLILLLVCLIAYLPLSSFLFALKNDAFIYNFPNKFFFSEALRSGYLPVWNPYLNYGFPLYADPGFAWWHPITWLFGLIGYNAYTFTIEVLLFIYIAGIGMYLVGNNLKFNKITSLLMGCMFMCSGFFIGNLQHINFITCAALLPWAYLAWRLYQAKPNLRNLFSFGLSAYLLFTGGHPAIPIAFLYFILLLTILYYIYKINNVPNINYLFNQLKLLFVTTLFLSPLLFSYFEILPFYTRFEAANQIDSSNVGFTASSYISFIAPFTTIKNTDWFGTDISMRNAYFTLSGVIFFLLALFSKEKSTEFKTLLITGLFILLLSTGGITKRILYEHLPGLSFIRTNGEFRVFSIFCFIICSAHALNKYFLDKSSILDSLKVIFKWLLGISLLLSIISLCYLFKEPVNWSIEKGLLVSIKYVIDHLNFRQSLSIASFTLLLLSFAYSIALHHQKRISLFLIFILADIIINTWMLLPFTGVGKTSVANMQTIIERSPDGFPVPSLSPKTKIANISLEDEALIGNWSWFDKEIVHKQIEYPSKLKNVSQFLNSKDLPSLYNKPFLFTKKKTERGLKVRSFSPGSIIAELHVEDNDTLILLQNNFPGWKAKVNDKRIPILPYYNAFISVPITPRNNIVEFYFSPLCK